MVGMFYDSTGKTHSEKNQVVVALMVISSFAYIKMIMIHILITTCNDLLSEREHKWRL